MTFIKLKFKRYQKLQCTTIIFHSVKMSYDTSYNFLYANAGTHTYFVDLPKQWKLTILERFQMIMQIIHFMESLEIKVVKEQI